MIKKKTVARKPLQVAQTKPASDPAATAPQTDSTAPAATKPKPAAQTKAAEPKRVAKTRPKQAAQAKAVSRSAPTDETPDELLDRGEKSKRLAKREAALADE